MWQVPLSDIEVDEELLREAEAALASGWWSMGPRVGALESQFADYVGAEHALAVANGTAALHLALLALGCGDGDEVVLPSLNFVAAANMILHTGARPVFCEIVGSGDLNLDVDDVVACLTPRTRAIVALHYGGVPCDIPRLREVAYERGIPLVEDAAHALGARLDGKACGTFGAVGCFSFFSNKNLPAGEGGMLVTSDEEIAGRLRALRSHGMTTLTWARHQGHASSYDVELPGFNYRIDELRAAIASVGLRQLDRRVARRREIVGRYRAAFCETPGVSLAFSSETDAISAHHLAVLDVGADRRDRVRESLKERGVQTSLHYPPIHLFTAYASSSARPLRQTEEAASRIVTLPLYPTMTAEQVTQVVASVHEALSS